MIRKRKLCLMLALAPIATAQMLSFNSTELPECAFGCKAIYAAQFACNGQNVPGGGDLKNWGCFCRSEYIQNLVNGKGASECSEACKEEGGEKTSEWIFGRCDKVFQKEKEEEEIKSKGNSTSTLDPLPSTTKSLTPTATGLPAATGSKPWISRAWPFLVLIIVLLLLPILAFALYRNFKHYLRGPVVPVDRHNKSRDGAESEAAMEAGESVEYHSPVSTHAPVLPRLSVLRREREAREREAGAGLLAGAAGVGMGGSPNSSGVRVNREYLETGLYHPGEEVDLGTSTQGIRITSTDYGGSEVGVAISTPGTGQVSPVSAQSPRDWAIAGAIAPGPHPSEKTALMSAPEPGIVRQWSWEEDEEKAFNSEKPQGESSYYQTRAPPPAPDPEPEPDDYTESELEAMLGMPRGSIGWNGGMRLLDTLQEVQEPDEDSRSAAALGGPPMIFSNASGHITPQPSRTVSNASMSASIPTPSTVHAGDQYQDEDEFNSPVEEGVSTYSTYRSTGADTVSTVMSNSSGLIR